MFYSVDLLKLKKNKRGRLPRCWLAATKKNFVGKGEHQLTKREILDTDLAAACDDVIDGITQQKNTPRLSLYLSSQLLYGITKMNSQKTKYLEDDCEKFLKSELFSELENKKKSKKTKDSTVPSETHQLNSEIDLIINTDQEDDQVLEVDIAELDLARLLDTEGQKDLNLIEEIDFRHVEPYSNLESLGVMQGTPPPLDLDDDEWREKMNGAQNSAQYFDQDEAVPVEDTSQQAPTKVVEGEQRVATPKRKFGKPHDATPTKRKRILSSEAATSPGPLLTKTSLTGKFEQQPIVADPVSCKSSLPAEVPSGQNAQEFLSYATSAILPTIEVEEVHHNKLQSTASYNELVIDPNRLMPPEQSVPEVAPVHLDNQEVQNVEQAVAPELVLEELDDSSLSASTRRKKKTFVFQDTNKQIAITYRSDSNALDTIHTRTMQSSLAQICDKVPADRLFLLPSSNLRSNILRKPFQENVRRAPCMKSLDSLKEQNNLVVQGEISNKNRRSSRQALPKDITESKSKTPVLTNVLGSVITPPASPRKHGSLNVDKDQMLMRPPSASPREILETAESVAASPAHRPIIESVLKPKEQHRPQMEPDVIEPEQEAQQQVVEDATNDVDTHERPQSPPDSNKSFLAGLAGSIRGESMQSELSDTASVSEDLLMTKQQFHDFLVEGMWKVSTVFELSDILFEGEASRMEVTRYMMYLFELEKDGKLTIEQEAPFNPVYISRESEN